MKEPKYMYSPWRYRLNQLSKYEKEVLSGKREDNSRLKNRNYLNPMAKKLPDFSFIYQNQKI
jgi:hypothetical protein